MSVALLVQTWKNPKTLANTLESYRKNGLLELVDELLMWNMENSSKNKNIGKNYGFTVYGSKRNLGAGRGFLRLSEIANSEYIILLEDDWELIVTNDVTRSELNKAKAVLSSGAASTVRMRHRKNPGIPLCSSDMKGHEFKCPQLLLETVYFRDDPVNAFPDIITRHSTGIMIVNCKWSAYTNNPTMYQTDWFYENITKHAPPIAKGSLYSSLEQYIHPHWLSLNHKVSHLPIGIFSHNDLGKK